MPTRTMGVSGAFARSSRIHAPATLSKLARSTSEKARIRSVRLVVTQRAVLRVLILPGGVPEAEVDGLVAVRDVHSVVVEHGGHLGEGNGNVSARTRRVARGDGRRMWDRASRDATLAGGGTHVIRREGVGGIAQEHGRLAHRAVADDHHLHGDVHLLALHLCVSGTDARACQRRGVAGSRERGCIRARARGRLGGFARGARDGSGETCRRKGSRTHGGRRPCAPTRRRRALLCRGRDSAILRHASWRALPALTWTSRFRTISRVGPLPNSASCVARDARSR